MKQLGTVWLRRGLTHGRCSSTSHLRWASSTNNTNQDSKASPEEGEGPSTSTTPPTSGSPEETSSNEAIITGGTKAGFAPEARVAAKQHFEPDGSKFSFETKPKEFTGLSADEVQLPHDKDVQKAIADFAKERRVRRDLGFSPGQLFEEPAAIPPPTRWKTFRPNRIVVTGKELHPLNAWALSKFLSPSGKILPRRQTGLSPKKQRKLAKVVKASRHLGLLGYTTQYNADMEEGRRFSPVKLSVDGDVFAAATKDHGDNRANIEEDEADLARGEGNGEGGEAKVDQDLKER